MDQREYWPPDHLYKRKLRGLMQQEATKGHASEEPWTNSDPHGYEFQSSRTAVVGMLIGYTGAAKEEDQSSSMTKSRKNDGTVNFKWEQVPHLVRPDYEVNSKASSAADPSESDHSSTNEMGADFRS